MVDGQPAPAAGLKEKLMAWWNGYDSPALVALDGCKRAFLLWWNGDPEAPSGVNLGARQVSKRTIEAPHVKKQDLSARMTVLQALWGEGNVTPGPAEFIVGLTNRLGLTSEMTMLDLGAGLGGPARAISSSSGIWVTAYEEVAAVAKAGMEQSIMQGLAKKVPIEHVEFATVERPKRKIDCFFSKDALHHISKKKYLLAAMEEALKPNGQFFIIDYVITEKGKSNNSEANWNKADEQVSHFWTKEEYLAAFAAVKLDLRVSEDLSPKYCEMIADGFRRLTKNMESLISEETDEARQSDLRRALAFESNRWAVRAEALQAGNIAVMRFSGTTLIKTEIR